VNGALGALNPSPVIELKRAVAVGLASGPGPGLELLKLLLGDGARALPAAARGAR
jgi:predicted RNA polymerase sigma factor